MRRIFESTFEPSHGFQPNCPWYGKNGMEGKKSLLCADVKALSIELASFYLERNDSLVWESSFTHYSSPLKKERLRISRTLNKNAEVSVPRGSPLSLFFSQHHQPLFSAWMGQSQMINRRKGDQKNRRTTYSIGRMFPWAVSSRSPLILGKLVAACEFFQGKGRPDSTLLFTLIRSRWFSPARRWSKFLWPSLSGPCEHLFLMY